ECTVDAAAVGHADHQGHVEIVVRAVSYLGRLVHNLVHGGVAEVGELDLGHRAHAVYGSPDGGPCYDRLGQWGVQHALNAELLGEAVGHAEHPASRPHVFAQRKHA